MEATLLSIVTNEWIQKWIMVIIVKYFLSHSAALVFVSIALSVDLQEMEMIMWNETGKIKSVSQSIQKVLTLRRGQHCTNNNST